MNPFACAYIFVKFTYLIQLNFVVQILVFQGIGAFLFSIKNYNLLKKKEKINRSIHYLHYLCIGEKKLSRFCKTIMTIFKVT